MVKSKKESITKVEAALDSKTKPSKKSKRDVEVDLDIPKDAKKQKKELIQAVEKAPPKKNKKKKKKKKKNANVEMAEAEQKPIAKQPKTLFAGRLPFHIEKSDLESFFKEVGEIKDVRLAKGIAHVEFASEEAAQKAMKLNGKPLLGRNILLDFANAKPAPRPRNLVKTIFVTGFNKSLSEDEMKTSLRAHFSDCGEIKRISLPYYQETGDSKGVAYLDFSEDGFNKAMELNESELGGRNIVVIEARPKEKNADGNSGRGNDDSSKRGPGRGNGEMRP
ncbi:PREDICTED: nucleolin 2-like [Brassica oleracea var. oleracea]|uniref:nucleolin 2-like n=1 Tax=Brassica oleracea var. oleracea TaxID=109376 RepID=UPI0006A6E8A7|nr:PREDICTED: nucleolin 2-like [Brassica oleracea var. oleracea]